MTTKMNLNKDISADLIKYFTESSGNVVDSLFELPFEDFDLKPVHSRSGLRICENVEIKIDISLLPTTKDAGKLVVCAFDTGNRLGFATIHNGIGVWGHTILVRDYNETPYPNVIAYEFAYNFVQLFSSLTNQIPIVLVEGSAISKRSSQEFMAQMRSGLFLGAYNYFVDAFDMHNHKRVYQVSPMTARKAVFGSGKIDPSIKFPEFNPNAIDALTIAWYGVLKNTEL